MDFTKLEPCNITILRLHGLKEKMGSFIEENLNTVICGNAYELIKNIPDKSIDLIYVDLPYQFASAGDGGAFGIRNRKYNLEIAFKKRKTIV